MLSQATAKFPPALKSLALLTQNSVASQNGGGGRSTSNHLIAPFSQASSDSVETTSLTSADAPSPNNNVITGLFKNFNLYWTATTLLAVWFLFVHTPPILMRRKIFTQDPLFVAHLVGAGGIYLACIHNALVTPSTFAGQARPFHVWVGRVGMGLGVLGALSGAILTWTRIQSVGLSFGIPITIGGVFQLFAQWRGYHFIQLYRQAKEDELKLSYKETADEADESLELQKKKKTYLSYHIGYMVGVFVSACGIPAVMRLLERFDDAWPFLLAIVALNMLSTVYAKWFIRRIPDPVPKQRNNSVLTETTPLL